MIILIVDDNIINVKFLESLIHAETEFETVSFTKPVEALTWCKSNDPDLIMVDYEMPEITGLAFIETVRHMPARKRTPIVMITGSEDREIKYRALELGVNDFLNKPVDKAELMARTTNMLTIRAHQKISAKKRASWMADEYKKTMKEIKDREQEVIFRLSKAAEFRSPETGNHVMRVAHYCREVVKAMGFTEDEQELILMAAPMHDIGKVATPDSILFKAGALDDGEYDLMKEHTSIGHSIMQDSKSQVLQLAAEIAICHHEKFDGSGYPRGLKGHEIPVVARVCSVCDVFDALTSNRSYKTAWSVEAAVTEIETKAGSHFDPEIVRLFKSVLPKIVKIKSRFADELESENGSRRKLA